MAVVLSGLTSMRITMRLDRSSRRFSLQVPYHCAETMEEITQGDEGDEMSGVGGGNSEEVPDMSGHNV